MNSSSAALRLPPAISSRRRFAPVFASSARGTRLSSASSPAEQSRSVASGLQRHRDANPRRNATISGSASSASAVSMRLRRGPVISMNRVSATAVSPPAVMPLPSSEPHHSPSLSAKIT